MNLKELNNSNDIITVSTFSGAGGLDIGAIHAGAKIVWANDMMKEACATYSTNIGEHIVRGNINEQIDGLNGIGNIDLVIGGPPCQGFSVAGKMDAQDARSQLIWSYAKVIEAVKPRAFVMENVKALGLLAKWKPIREKLLALLRSFGYSVNFMVLNASDYDVPQARERVFVVGFRGDSKKMPDLLSMMEGYKHKAPTVREALSVLDRAGQGNNKGICKAKITLASNPVMRKTAYAGMIFNGLGRPIRIDGYCATLPASMGGNKTPIIDENELYDNKDPWVVDYHKKITEDPSLAEFRPAPDFLRRLTVEEAALLQTFPIDYNFQGSQSSKYTQIGNAVPCNLGKAVVKMVIDVLHGNSKLQFLQSNVVELKLDF
jgi:DNA (cytosine-5)-methyltransferase 1